MNTLPLPTETDDYELEQPTETSDIDKLVEMVRVGESEGLTAAQILDPQELESYREFTENERKQPPGHYDNLVDSLPDTLLRTLATNTINHVRWDEETREDWSKRESEGIRLLGVSDRRSVAASFKGASSVNHPLLVEAVTQFHSRALAEIWPPEGPVKCVTLGNSSEELIAQAERVQDYMNYQYTEEMPGAFEEEDNLLFRLPLSGSCFKKIYYDPLLDKLCSRLIEPADFIVPFSATDLQTAPRYTHRYRESHNQVMKKVKSGYYAKTRILNKPVNETWDYPNVKTEIDHTEGRQRVSMDDSRHTILEMYIDLEMEDTPLADVDEFGEPTGVALPYIVWCNRDDQEILRIQRNWEPDDERQTPEINCVHYRFMPGLGFYGYGLLHLIGGLAKSSTGALNALLDAAAFANLQGGFVTRDARLKMGDNSLSPGQWLEIDCSAEEISKAFFSVPYKEPSPTLFKLMEYLDERGQRFAGTTDVMLGDVNVNNAPVGSTMAMIEQGGKTFSAIHRRLHVAHRNEFRILAKMNSRYIPENGYPYFTAKGDRMVMASDFDKRVDVVPVSDPSIISNTQRIVQAQEVLQMAEKYPEKIDMNLAIKAMLQALRVSNYEELLKTDPLMQKIQAQLQQLELQQKQADLEKTQAEKEGIDAVKTDNVVKGLYTVIQTVNAANPLLLGAYDSLFKSSGGKDYNGLPLIDPNVLANAGTGQVPLPANTNPLTPANPPSPGIGADQGIETARNDPQQPNINVDNGMEEPTTLQ
jgi:hypothetical protein